MPHTENKGRKREKTVEWSNFSNICFLSEIFHQKPMKIKYFPLIKVLSSWAAPLYAKIYGCLPRYPKSLLGPAGIANTKKHTISFKLPLVQIHSFPRREEVVQCLSSSLHQTTLSDSPVGFAQLEQLLPWPKKPARSKYPAITLQNTASPFPIVHDPLPFPFIHDHWES